MVGEFDDCSGKYMAQIIFFADGIIDFTKYRTDLNELYQPKGPETKNAPLCLVCYMDIQSLTS